MRTSRWCYEWRFVSSFGVVLAFSYGSLDCMSASIELAHEYVKLGRRKRAGIIFSQCLEYVKSDRLPDEICALFYLRFAEALALAGDIPRRFV